MSDILEQIQELQEKFGALINETSDERAHAATVETTRRYNDARNALEAIKAMIKNGKDFYTKDEIEDLKKKAKSQEEEFKKASNNRVRDNKNQFNRDKRLMNDNNSHNEVMAQIMDLKEAFSNLFEVDDLGQPAVDVPPSQNKIKKDRKTKDGKVELVSVEDELFPYEGDKKEQYRQKIIATINNMIQGTATLEDLLQIVRQKKAPLKEAMELMEELLLERNKENRDKKEKWELKTNRITKKEKKAIQDYAKEQGDEAKLHQAAADDYDHIYSQQPAMAPDGTPNSVAAYFNGKYQEMLRNKGRNEQNIADNVEPLTKKLKNRKHAFHDMVRGWTESEALEEALTIISEVSKEFLKDKDDKAKVKVLKAIIKHGETMTPENPEGDSELLKIRQDSIDRLKKYREKCNDYLEKKEKRNDK